MVLETPSLVARYIEESACVHYLVVGGDGRVLSANRAALEHLGVSEGTVLGKPLWGWIEPVDEQRLRAWLAGDDDLGAGRLRLTFRPAAAPEYVLSGWIEPLGDGFVLVGEVSPGTLAERQALAGTQPDRAANVALRGQVADLARIEAELRRSNAELEQFAYVASHDLQEPLRMVVSYLQLIERRYKGQLDETADEFIAYAVDGAKRMQVLIDDLLAYSRVGRKGGVIRPVSLDEVLDGALHSLEAAIRASGAVVEREPLPTVQGDPSQLRQLFQNLLANAIKFQAEGVVPRVRVEAEREDAGWRLAVRDNGIGIAPEFQERIFVLFQRLHGRGEYAGTGIGLAISQKIVERHGGRIWVESAPGAGTTFYFTLPDAQEAA